jgi:hypothetical protein
MAKTISESFQQFASNLNISDRQETLVSICRKNVVDKIANKLILHSEQPSKLIGSYDRNTLIRYLYEADVDVMVVLHYGENKHWDNDEGVLKVLSSFETIIEESYPDTECQIDRNCVTMKLSQFRQDVVPAFKFQEGYYTIPDTHRGKWIQTDPVGFAEEITRINKNMDGDFVPLIKMIKGWNREYSKRLRSFHLECIMVNHYRKYDKSYTFDSMAKVFFANLPDYISSAVYDPITMDRVDLYLDNSSLNNKRDDYIERAKKTSKLAEEAYQDSEKYPSVAMDEWKKIFGEFFPAYG